MRRIGSILSVLVVLWAGARGAHAERGHHPHYPYLAGLKAVGTSHVEHGETGIGVGAGIFLERAIIEDIIDIEISLVAAVIESEMIVPVDVIAKSPLWTSHSLTFYAGGGLSLTYENVNDEALFRPGIAAQAGLYLWPWEHVGIDVELDYNLLLTPNLGHELNVALGPIMRF